jgi:hypothetical protein
MVVFKSEGSMASGQQPLEAPADEVSTGARVPDVAALLKQIKEHQEAYEVLYSRNVLLHTELTEVKQVIECLRIQSKA